jgi:hypothetical protein
MLFVWNKKLIICEVKAIPFWPGQALRVAGG